MDEFDYEKGVQYLSNQLTEIERSSFIKYVNSSEDHKHSFDELKRIWNSSDELENRYRQNETPNWNYFEEKFNFPRKKPVWSYVAAAAVLIAATFYWFQMGYTEVRSGFNEQKEVVFVDGSSAKLNYSSSISYQSNFTESERLVELNGEAFFSVVKDGRPFKVKTKESTITVLGTSFNIKNRDDVTNVYVNSGTVKVQNTDTSFVILTKGMSSVVEKDKKPKLLQRFSSEVQLGWVNKKLVFDNHRIDEILKELHYAYGVHIKIDNTLKGERVSAIFNLNTPIEKVIESVSLLIGAKLYKKDNHFIITHE